LVSDPDLAAAFARGEPMHNPAYGLVAGTIAPWRTDEPASVTMAASSDPPARTDSEQYPVRARVPSPGTIRPASSCRSTS